MGAQVDELIEQIRVEADRHRARQDRDTPKPNGSAVAELDRLRANLMIAERAQDRLPPVTSYRHGRLAKIELWIKRRLKQATRWFTWEQTNFNAATCESFNTTLTILARLEQNISDLRDQIDALKDNERNMMRMSKGPGAQQSIDQVRDQIQQLESRKSRRAGATPPPVPAGLSMAIGSAYFRLNDLANAEREYKAAVDVNPNFGEAHNNLAVVYFVSGRVVLFGNSDCEMAVGNPAEHASRLNSGGKNTEGA